MQERRWKAGKPLDLEIDHVTNKIVGLEDQTFICMLGSQTSLLCPGHYLDFKDVHDQFKDQVLNQMKINNKSFTLFYLLV